MQHYFLALLLLLASMCASAEVLAPESMLEKMGRALRELNYSGLFTYEHGTDIESLEVKHVVIDGEEFEKLRTLSGEINNVVRRGHSLNCIHPGADLLAHGVSSAMVIDLSAKTISPEKSLLNHYRIVDLGRNRVAGRDVQVLMLQSKDAYRNSVQLSLDTVSGLTLKRVVLSPESHVLERLQFVSLDLAPSFSSSEFEASENSLVAHPMKMSPLILPDKQIEIAPSWLPPGFTLAEGGEYPGSVKMLMYSDGLSAFSIMLEALADDNAQPKVEGKARRGATVAFTRPIAISGDAYLLTIMGDVPLFTAARVARHIALRQPG